MENRTLIRGGQVVLGDGVLEADLLIEGERIAALAKTLDVVDAEVLDANGCYVLPGLVDPHTHIVLNTGIYHTPDDWESGTRTAACGGVTTVIDFATQFPGQDAEQALECRLEEIGNRVQIDYGLHLMMTELPPQPDLAACLRALPELGLRAVKLFTTYRPNYYQDDAALLRAMEAAANAGVLMMLHCENDALVSAETGRLLSEGRDGLAYHGKARPALAEVEAAHRALFLAQNTGCPLYVVHCSVSGTVDQVTAARRMGQIALAETTPQYLLLDEGMYAGEHPEWVIMQPPLRAAEEKDALWRRLAANEIQTVGTDHCDYSIQQKNASPRFSETPGGIPGMETMLPLLATYGPLAGRITWPQLAAVTSANPARIFALDRKGSLLPGYDADVVVYDPRPIRTIKAADLHGVAGYTPYEGRHVQGQVRDVFSRGRALVRGGEFQPAPGWGRFVK